MTSGARGGGDWNRQCQALGGCAPMTELVSAVKELQSGRPGCSALGSRPTTRETTRTSPWTMKAVRWRPQPPSASRAAPGKNSSSPKGSRTKPRQL